MFNFEDVKINNFDLKILKSDIFSNNNLKHFFSTRLGGNTPSPLNSFTLSAKDYTNYDNFAKDNLKIACKILDGDFNNLIIPNQQHTDNIAVLKNTIDIKKLEDNGVDGIVTNLKNYPVCLVFADCVPVLLFDEQEEVLACVHAGWKGTAKKIAQKAVEIMIKEFNSKVENISVVIGPAICQNCFEVNYDVASQLGIDNIKDYDNIFISKQDKVLVDLKKLNKYQLEKVGITKIDISGYCTCCNNDIFYSYRGDNNCTGRHGMLAIIKE